MSRYPARQYTLPPLLRVLSRQRLSSSTTVITMEGESPIITSTLGMDSSQSDGYSFAPTLSVSSGTSGGTWNTTVTRLSDSSSITVTGSTSTTPTATLTAADSDVGDAFRCTSVYTDPDNFHDEYTSVVRIAGTGGVVGSSPEVSSTLGTDTTQSDGYSFAPTLSLSSGTSGGTYSTTITRTSDSSSITVTGSTTTTPTATLTAADMDAGDSFRCVSVYTDPDGLTDEYTSVIRIAGTGGVVGGPSITSSATATSVVEGNNITYTATADAGDVVWWIEDDDGTGVTINAVTGVLSGGATAPDGTYTLVIYCANDTGISSAFNLSWTLTPFVLSSDNAFGDLSETWLQVQLDATLPQPGIDGKYYYWGTGVVVSGTLDVQGTLEATAQDHSIWYNEAAGRLLAFNYSGGSTVSLVTVSVSDFDNTSTNQSVVSSSTVTSNEKLGGLYRGKYVPGGYYQILNPASEYYLTITPGSGDTVLDSFGTKSNGSWAYGFTAVDDIFLFGGAPQMLSPASVFDGAFVFGIGAYFITTTVSEFVAYGDFTSGPYSNTSGILLGEDSDGVWVKSGEMVVIHFDDSDDTFYIYVNGSLVFSTSSPSTYMDTGTTSEPVLHWGNPINSDLFDDETSPRPWGHRIAHLWLTSVGTSLTSTEFLEMAAHASDLTASDNYASVDLYWDSIKEGAPIKGDASLARATFS